MSELFLQALRAGEVAIEDLKVGAPVKGYQTLDMFRRSPGARRSEMVVIGYWEAEEGPAIVQKFVYIDETGHRTAVRSSRVIGRTLEEVIRDQEGGGFRR